MINKDLNYRKKTVPCEICKEPTPMTGTKLCNFCWENERRFGNEHDENDGHYGEGEKPKGQTKKHSIVEIGLSTFIGYWVAFFTQIIVFPWFGVEVSHSANMVITLIFTIVSVIRSYFVRRLFNLIYIKGWF